MHVRTLLVPALLQNTLRICATTKFYVTSMNHILHPLENIKTHRRGRCNPCSGPVSSVSCGRRCGTWSLARFLRGVDGICVHLPVALSRC